MGEGRGQGAARPARGKGQLTRAQLTGKPDTVVISRQRLGTRGVGTGGQCGGSGVPCRRALRGVSLGSERPVESRFTGAPGLANPEPLGLGHWPVVLCTIVFPLSPYSWSLGPLVQRNTETWSEFGGEENLCPLPALT